MTATVAAGEFVSATSTKSNITFTTFTDTSEFAQNVTATSTANSAPTIAGWYNASWLYRKQITIDHTKVSGGANLTDFPVLINLGTDANLAASALANGNDILFTSADGTTKLSHEIQTFVSATGALMAWVKVPTLSASVDTPLYIYYGNAAAANQQNASGVWSNGYAGVWHLDGNASDTSGNANNGAFDCHDLSRRQGRTGVGFRWFQQLCFHRQRGQPAADGSPDP